MSADSQEFRVSFLNCLCRMRVKGWGADLTERRLTAIIAFQPMGGNPLESYAPLLILLLAAMILSAVLVGVSTFIGYQRPSRTKQQAYECGVTPTGDAREPVSVKFYLVAMVFILFDVEAIFLYPWAFVYRSLHWFGFIEMLMYILILLVGYIYLWKKGALDWNR